MLPAQLLLAADDLPEIARPLRHRVGHVRGQRREPDREQRREHQQGAATRDRVDPTGLISNDLTTAGTVASGHTRAADYAGLHTPGTVNPTGPVHLGHARTFWTAPSWVKPHWRRFFFK